MFSTVSDVVVSIASVETLAVSETDMLPLSPAKLYSSLIFTEIYTKIFITFKSASNGQRKGSNSPRTKVTG